MAPAIQRITTPTIDVLETLATTETPLPCGQIAVRSRHQKTTVYKILERLESNDWLKSDWLWPSDKPHARRPKRVYQLTPTGKAEAEAILYENGKL